MRFILSHIGRHPTFGVTMIVGAFSNAALAAVVPSLGGLAINIVATQGGTMTDILPVVLVIVASQLARGGLQLMRNASAETFGQRIERDARDELYASLLGKSMSFHDLQPVGDIMARATNDVRELNLMMNPGLNLVIGSGMFLLIPLISVPLIYPQLLLVPFVFIVAYIWAQIRFVRTLRPVAEEARKSFGQMNSRLAETLDGLQIVKGAAQEEQEVSIFNRLAETVRQWFIKQGDIEARYLPFLLLGLTEGIGFVHAINLYHSGAITIGQIVAFMGTLQLFGFPVFTSLGSLAQLASGYASAARILSIIKAENEIDQNTAGATQVIAGAITFEQVSFAYMADQEVLHDISFTVKPGQTVAIVGQTGSGKSTIAKLLNRTYDTNSGRILIDGIDVRQWNMESLRSQISIIEQDIFLFSRTIAENIKFGRPDATQEDVEGAARKAQAHGFIEEFPDGYNTVIGQRGVTLSGGQRQRLALARAFLTNPPILILDDSTSAIDSATEDLIQRAIRAAAEGRTTVLITHRLSQIRWADHIVVLRKGRVAAQGTHEDLLARSEAYRRIFARYEGVPKTTPLHT